MKKRNKEVMSMEAGILRTRARSALAGRWGISIGVAALAALLGGLLVGSTFLPGISYRMPIPMPLLEKMSAALNNDLRLGRFTLSIRSGIFGLAVWILGGTLQLGYAQFLLKQLDGKDAEFNDLFSQFHRFGTGFAQHFLRSLYVALWGILLVIPGIMKSYSYAMTPFILADHPNLTASQAISWSEELMDGHKMDLFVLDLTFLGWSILAGMFWNLGHLLLNPYRNAAYAAFYRQIQQEKRNDYT